MRFNSLIIHIRLWLKRALVTTSLVICAFVLFAQQQPARRGSRVIDDSTKQVYGPRTSRYFYETDVFFNKIKYHQIDTLIRNFHRWNYVQSNMNLYQDLGNIGTAIQPIYYQAPEVIGARSGAHVYDMYWNREQIRYFDTKSPYSNMNVILGGKGRSVTRVTFSRNINPRWNFGFTYRGLYIDKQILRRGKGDRITRSHYYDFYTSYRNKDSTYRIFANVRRMYHRVNEYGGVLVEGADSTFADYFAQNARPWLTHAESNDLRTNYHLFHQYSLGKGLQIYHIGDRYRQRNVFLNVRDEQSDKFFHIVFHEADTTKDAIKANVLRNEIGVKGSLAKLFYNGYAALRNYKQFMNHDSTTDKINELYLGGRIALQLDSVNEVNGWLEVNDHGNFRLQGEIKSKWFDVRAKQLIYHPGGIPLKYYGGHHIWIDSLGGSIAPVSATQVNGYVHYRSTTVDISPGLTFSRLSNYVFYEKVLHELDTQQVFPRQSAGTQIIASPELRFTLTFFRHVSFSNQIIYTKLIENADDAIRVPDLFVNTQLSYANIFFNGNLDMHAGVDVHWKSEYYAPAYDPAIRQFYNQNEVKVAGYPLVDIFFNAKVKRGRIFFKYHNLLQAFTKQGYFITPYYPGQANIIDFGFDWSFYD